MISDYGSYTSDAYHRFTPTNLRRAPHQGDHREHNCVATAHRSGPDLRLLVGARGAVDRPDHPQTGRGQRGRVGRDQPLAPLGW
jgi:hypothetical protein